MLAAQAREESLEEASVCLHYVVIILAGVDLQHL